MKEKCGSEEGDLLNPFFVVSTINPVNRVGSDSKYRPRKKKEGARYCTYFAC